jgi:uncharacterized membrane protein YeiH
VLGIFAIETSGLPVQGAVAELFRVVDLLGVFGNAALGGIVARRRKMDPIGFVALAILSGLGGGVIRDVLLQHGPPAALVDDAYMATAVLGAVAAFFLPFANRLWAMTFPVIDAFALGCWASTGAFKTLSIGLGWLPALLLGTVTAVGGGALRDLTVQRTPQIFGGNTLYATCAVAASAVMTVFWRLGLASAGLVVATLVGAGFCLLARWRGWQLWQGLSWEYSFERRGRFPRLSVRVRGERRQQDSS